MNAPINSSYDDVDQSQADTMSGNVSSTSVTQPAIPGGAFSIDTSSARLFYSMNPDEQNSNSTLPPYTAHTAKSLITILFSTGQSSDTCLTLEGTTSRSTGMCIDYHSVFPQLGIKSRCSLSKFLSFRQRRHRNGSKLRHRQGASQTDQYVIFLSIIIATMADRLCCHLGDKPILAETKGIRALLLNKDHPSMIIGNYQTSKNHRKL